MIAIKNVSQFDPFGIKIYISYFFFYSSKKIKWTWKILKRLEFFLPGYQSTCVKKCLENLSEVMRDKIHKHYWQLTKEIQKQWMVNTIETVHTLQPRKRISGKKERKCTRTFFLEKQEHQKIQVCQVMFLLGLKNENHFGKNPWKQKYFNWR